MNQSPCFEGAPNTHSLGERERALNFYAAASKQKVLRCRGATRPYYWESRIWHSLGESVEDIPNSNSKSISQLLVTSLHQHHDILLRNLRTSKTHKNIRWRVSKIVRVNICTPSESIETCECQYVPSQTFFSFRVQEDMCTLWYTILSLYSSIHGWSPAASVPGMPGHVVHDTRTTVTNGTGEYLSTRTRML